MEEGKASEREAAAACWPGLLCLVPGGASLLSSFLVPDKEGPWLHEAS